MAQVTYPEPPETLEDLRRRNAALTLQLTHIRKERDEARAERNALRAHLSVGVTARDTAAEVARLTALAEKLTAERDEARAQPPPLSEAERRELRKLRQANQVLRIENNALRAGYSARKISVSNPSPPHNESPF